MVSMNESIRSSRVQRWVLVAAAACCAASSCGAAGASPGRPEELFQTNRVWTLHLTLTAEAWQEMQAAGGTPQPFGGPRPGGAGPGAPPNFANIDFSPGGMLAPHMMADGDADKNG